MLTLNVLLWLILPLALTFVLTQCGSFFAQFLPVIPQPWGRIRVVIAFAIPLLGCGAFAIYQLVPHLDTSMPQPQLLVKVLTAAFWCFTVPAGLVMGVSSGLDRAARRTNHT